MSKKAAINDNTPEVVTLNGFVIEKDVKLPLTLIQPNFPFNEMEDGDSILVPAEKYTKSQIKYAVEKYNYKEEHESKLVVRESSEGTRIWKTKK